MGRRGYWSAWHQFYESWLPPIVRTEKALEAALEEKKTQHSRAFQQTSKNIHVRPKLRHTR